MDNSKIQQRNKVYGQLTIEPPLSNAERMFLEAFIKRPHFEDVHNIESDIYDTASIMASQNMPQKDLASLVANSSALFRTKKEIFPGVSCPLILINPCNKGVIGLSVDSKHKEKEKSSEWICFIIEHFLKPNALATIIYPKKCSFLQSHTVNGTIWIKNEKVWEAQKIEVKNNIVTHSVASTPVILPGVNNEKITVAINKKNYQAVRFNFDSNSFNDYRYRNTSLEKQYHDMNVENIVCYNQTTEPIIVEIPKSELLEKLIFVSSLKSQLQINPIKTKKIKL